MLFSLSSRFRQFEATEQLGQVVGLKALPTFHDWSAIPDTWAYAAGIPIPHIHKWQISFMEFELKLEIPSDRLASVEAALREAKTARQHLQARYFDTGDGRLARHGIVLRIRKEGRRWVQTSKAPSDGLMARLEHNASLVKPAGAALPAANLARHAGTPVGERIGQALGLAPGEAFPDLVPLYETDVWRMSRSIELSGSVIEVALDLGRVFSGPYSEPLCELEVELKHGKPEHAVQLARDWCAGHGLWLSSISKSMKGRRLGGGRCGPAVSAIAPDFDRKADGRQIAAEALRSCLAQVIGNASEVAGGCDGVETVHQLRVGIRRLRTAARELSTLAPGIDPAWQAPLVDAFRVLGRQRDRSHVVMSVQPQIEAAGGPALDMRSASNVDMADLATALRSPTFQDALLGLIGFVQGNHAAGESLDPKAAKKALRLRLKKLRAQVVKDGDKFMSLDEALQHRVRKRLKRLRYLAEFALPLFSADKVKKFVAGLKPAQDALGLYNDELMALAAYRALADTDEKAWFGAGWLTARHQPNALGCQHDLEALAQVQPFWD